MAKQFTDSNFDSDVLQSDKPVLVDFWAEWCGPCRMIGPIVEELHTEYEGKAVIGKLNVDENPEVSAKYGVRSIPTLLIFKGGQLVDKQVGVVPKSALVKKLEDQMA
ncbi:MAG: thioredoxin [Flavobacteriales bacterium]|nr:thioredoxin [Flavobacteriales bacterium]